jgi:ABC-type uncharacterized transport system ATPase subunit
MSDRVAVMHRGTVVRVLDRAEATQENILAIALEVNRKSEIRNTKSETNPNIKFQ